MTAPHLWLRDLRTRLKLRQSEVEARTAALGEEARVTQSYLSKLEGGTKPLGALTPRRLDALRRVYRVDAAEWAARTGLHVLAPHEDGVSGALEFVRVPVRVTVTAGAPLHDDGDEVVDTELVPREEYRNAMLVLEVQGDSMTSAEGGIRHGDRIYVDPGDLELREGRVYVLHVSGGGTVVKRVRRFPDERGGQEFWLTSDNPDYPPLRPDRATVIGRVYYHQPRGRRL